MEFKTKIKRRFISLKEFLISQPSRHLACKKLVEILYSQHYQSQYQIKKTSLASLACSSLKPVMSCYPPKDGNMSLQEILVISALCMYYQPQTILEIGTFNGLTTLQLALNTPPSTIIHTLDIESLSGLDGALWEEDIKFMLHPEKKEKYYRNFPERSKIQEHLGNSLTYDFNRFQSPNFIFIDGGHSYPIVKSDTIKSLEILSNQGIIIWHDYCCHCEGVFRYLNKLQEKIPLHHIEGTSLVVYQKL